MTNFNFRKNIVVLIVCLILSASLSISYASVTMMGTRIIYNSKSKSVDVNLKNQSDFPYVVQAWFDDGDPSITPNDKTNVPFFATPPIFKVQPNTTQIVRIAYTNTQQLPQDRESVFYFNFLQIPPSNVGDAVQSNKNKMLVMLKSRVKLFYRPDGLAGKPDDLLKKLQIKKITSGKNLSIEISNPSPFYASFGEVSFTTNNKKTYQAQSDMIEPFGRKTFTFKNVAMNENGSVKVTFINDQGARLSEHYLLEK